MVFSSFAGSCQVRMSPPVAKIEQLLFSHVWLCASNHQFTTPMPQMSKTPSMKYSIVFS
jgi:hypothetical protein